MKTKTKFIVNGGLVAFVIIVIMNLYASPDLPFHVPWNFPKPTPTVDAAPNPKIPHPDSERVVTFNMEREWSGKPVVVTIVALGVYNTHDVNSNVKKWHVKYRVPRDSEVYMVVDIPPHGDPPTTTCRIEVGGLLAVGDLPENSSAGSGKLTCGADIM